MKSMQNEKVPKTNGRSKNFEGHMIATSEIVKIRLEICMISGNSKSACAPDHRNPAASATVKNSRNLS